MCDEQMGCVRTSFCRNSRSGSVGGTDSGSSIRLSSRVDLAPGRRRRRRSSARYRCAVRSMKRDGQSLSEVAKKEMGPVAGFCTGLAMLFIITITMAGLSMVVLNALEKKPLGYFRRRDDDPDRYGRWPVLQENREFKGSFNRRHYSRYGCGFVRAVD